MRYFRAPWGWALILSTLLGIASCLLLGYAFWTGIGLVELKRLQIVLAFAPSLLVLGAFCFSIFGYSVTDEAIFVWRFFWRTKISLENFVSAESVPNTMAEGMRVNGNGGFFSFSGDYRNTALGNYKAYVTDLNRTVVLKFKDKNIVISPADADAFIASLKPH